MSARMYVQTPHTFWTLESSSVTDLTGLQGQEVHEATRRHDSGAGRPCPQHQYRNAEHVQFTSCAGTVRRHAWRNPRVVLRMRDLTDEMARSPVSHRTILLSGIVRGAVGPVCGQPRKRLQSGRHQLFIRRGRTVPIPRSSAVQLLEPHTRSRVPGIIRLAVITRRQGSFPMVWGRIQLLERSRV